MQTKYCKYCGTERPISVFSPHHMTKDGVMKNCRWHTQELIEQKRMGRFTDFKEFRYFLMKWKYDLEYLDACIPGVEIIIRNYSGKIVCRGYGGNYVEAEQNIMEKWNDRVY